MSKVFCLTLLLSLLFLSRADIDLSRWELFAENTRELSVRGQRMGRVYASPWKEYGFPVAFLDLTTQTWKDEHGDIHAMKVKVGSTHEWHSNNDKYAFFRSLGNPTWSGVKLTNVVELELGTNDEMWTLGNENPQRVYKQLNALGTPTTVFMNQEAAKLAVDPFGNAWVIKANGDIWRYTGSIWEVKPGTANQIAIGSDNRPVIVSRLGESQDGFDIKKWNPAGYWDEVPGIQGIFVTVDSQNQMYVVTKDNRVFRQKGFASRFCPMCQPGCQGSVCQNFEGICTAGRECATCLPGTVTMYSPLRCESCPTNCLSCSSSTTCTVCQANYYLSPTGTCLSSCSPPLAIYLNSAGRLSCKGPCADFGLNKFYYPIDQSCRRSCGVPIILPNEIYQSCNACPDNCQTCSSTSVCTRCDEPYFLTSSGTCISSCPFPMINYYENGISRCKGPCADQGANSFYYPIDGSCRSTCGMLIFLPGALYPSCNPCPDDCATCSSPTQCTECSPNHYLSSLGTCLSSCGFPMEITPDGKGCKGPCDDQTVNIFYYPSNNTCQKTCGIPIPNPEGLFDSCEACPDDCLSCSNTNSCEVCISTSFLSPLGTCLSSCLDPLVSYKDANQNWHCEGPCASQTTNTYYYPSNNTCRATCDLPIAANPGDFYDSCDPCPSDCLECSDTSHCLRCISTSFLYPSATCLPSCPPPLVSSQDSHGNWYCKAPCADQPTNTYYHPIDGSCRSTCGVPLPNNGEFYDTCDPCPSGCETCSSTTHCTRCDSNHFLNPFGECLSSCEDPLISFSDASGNHCKGPCADETTDVYYYPSNDTCQATCGVPIINPEDFYARCEPCPNDCLLCSSTTTCEECISNSFLSPLGTCLSSCEAPLVDLTEDGILQCQGPCAEEIHDIYYYPADDTCRASCNVSITTPTDIYERCVFCPSDCLSCSSPTNCQQCNFTHFLSPIGKCRASCDAPLRNFTDENGNLNCKGPCDDNLFYYPADDTCRPTCEVEVQSLAPFYKSCKTHELRTITQSFSQTATQALNILAIGSIRGVSAGIAGKIFPTIKFLNISYSDELETALYTWRTKYTPFQLSFPVLDGIKDQEHGREPLPDIFEKREVSPSLLLNLWDPLSYGVCITAAFLVTWTLAFLASKSGPEKSFISQFLTALRVLTQNYLIGYIYTTFGDVVFYSIIEFQTGSLSTGLHRLGFFVAVTLLVVMSLNVLANFVVLQEYGFTKKANKKTEGKALEKFKEEYKGFKMFFLEFNDDSFFQQAFLIFLVARDILFSVVLITGFEDPFTQVIILLSLNLLMIFYLLWKKPIKGELGVIHQFFNELVFFAVLSSLLVLTILDQENSAAAVTRNRIGDVIINLNFIFNVVSTIFLVAQIFKTLLKNDRSSSTKQKQTAKFDLITEETHSVVEQRNQTDISSSSEDEDEFRGKSKKSSKPISRTNNKVTKKQTPSRKANRHQDNLRLIETESIDPINEEEITSPKTDRMMRRKVTRSNSETRLLGQIISRLISTKDSYNNL